jgi:hypothetical protein
LVQRCGRERELGGPGSVEKCLHQVGDVVEVTAQADRNRVGGAGETVSTGNGFDIGGHQGVVLTHRFGRP